MRIDCSFAFFVANKRKKPGQKLPITPKPAQISRIESRVAGGKRIQSGFIAFDAAGVSTFEKIVTYYSIIHKRTRYRGIELTHPINSLTGIIARTEHIRMHVVMMTSICVKARRAAEYTCEKRLGSAFRSRIHTQRNNVFFSVIRVLHYLDKLGRAIQQRIAVKSYYILFRISAALDKPERKSFVA